MEVTEAWHFVPVQHLLLHSVQQKTNGDLGTHVAVDTKYVFVDLMGQILKFVVVFHLL